jgi:lipoate synthase
MILQLIERCWHRKVEKQKNPTQLQIILQGCENYIRQLGATTAPVQEVQDEHCTQFQNETESVKEVMKVTIRHPAQFQNVLDLLKTIKAGDEQNQTGLIEEAMTAGGKRRAQIQRKMH